jgi:hypothetical protein
VSDQEPVGPGWGLEPLVLREKCSRQRFTVFFLSFDWTLAAVFVSYPIAGICFLLSVLGAVLSTARRFHNPIFLYFSLFRSFVAYFNIFGLEESTRIYQNSTMKRTFPSFMASNKSFSWLKHELNIS